MENWTALSSCNLLAYSRYMVIHLRILFEILSNNGTQFWIASREAMMETPKNFIDTPPLGNPITLSNQARTEEGLAFLKKELLFPGFGLSPFQVTN